MLLNLDIDWKHFRGTQQSPEAIDLVGVYSKVVGETMCDKDRSILDYPSNVMLLQPVISRQAVGIAIGVVRL